MTTYVVLLPGVEDAWEQATAEQQAQVFSRHEEFARLLTERGHRITAGEELTHSRTAKQVSRDPAGRTVVTDGPFAETAEQLSGFYVVESDDLDDLLQICAVLAEDPAAGNVGVPVEVRAAVDHTADGG